MLKIAAFCFLSLVVSVSAIVVQDYTLAEAAPVGLDWGYVYNYKGSSAVAVDNYWIVTAAHVADDGGSGSLTIDGTIYNQQEIIFHPTVDGKTPDLALVRYDKVLPGHYSLYTGSLPNLSVLMVGYGATGAAHADYWTVDGTGGGAKRWGSQKIDRTYIKTVDAEGVVGLTKTAGFEMDFDLGSTTNEAGGAIGDSGGGVFYNDGGIWKLAGINSSVSESEGQFDATFAVAMPYYADWIADTIPEPAALGLMGFATLGLFLSRAKRRRKLAGRSLFPIRGDESLCDNFFDTQEVEAGREGRIHAYLTGMKEMINASPLPGWMNVLHTRYQAVNDAVWRSLVTAIERSSFRKEVAGERFKLVVTKGLDVFLERISWDQIVMLVKSGRAKARRFLSMRALKSLDAFLAKISWDQLAAAYRRCKKAIRRFRR